MSTREQEYKQSNEVLTMPSITAPSREKTRFLNSSTDRQNRQENAQRLITSLCKAYGLPTAKVYVVEQKQPARVSQATNRLLSKMEGKYNIRTMAITLYNRTARQNKVVAIKTLYGTLLHEFMHHYDHKGLGFLESMHTQGFYTRIREMEKMF